MVKERCKLKIHILKHLPGSYYCKVMGANAKICGACFRHQKDLINHQNKEECHLFMAPKGDVLAKEAQALATRAAAWGEVGKTTPQAPPALLE